MKTDPVLCLWLSTDCFALYSTSTLTLYNLQRLSLSTGYGVRWSNADIGLTNISSMHPNFETGGSRDRLAKRWCCHSKYSTAPRQCLATMARSWFSVLKPFLKPVMYDVINFMLMSRAKNYSNWDTFARDIAINLRGPVFLRHSVQWLQLSTGRGLHLYVVIQKVAPDVHNVRPL